jgi:hypothetical protein
MSEKPKVATLSPFPSFRVFFFFLLFLFFFSPLIWTISVRYDFIHIAKRASRERERKINTNYINPAEKPIP